MRNCVNAERDVIFYKAQGSEKLNSKQTKALKTQRSKPQLEGVCLESFKLNTHSFVEQENILRSAEVCPVLIVNLIFNAVMVM